MLDFPIGSDQGHLPLNNRDTQLFALLAVAYNGSRALGGIARADLFWNGGRVGQAVIKNMIISMMEQRPDMVADRVSLCFPLLGHNIADVQFQCVRPGHWSPAAPAR